MKIELRWLASISTSCFHAAEAISRGKEIIDRNLADRLAEPLELLLRELAAAGIPSEKFWDHLIPLSATIDSNRLLVETVLRKTIGPAAQAELLTQRLSPLITKLEQATQAVMPEGLDELALRCEPIRQQWEARGPGLLADIAQQTDDQLIVSDADVILVLPARGGSATAHLAHNSVRLEAVLANPIDAIPETVRLGWALSQLNIDLPVYSETIAADRLPLIAKLAMLPITLKASEFFDLAVCNEQTIKTAISAWGIDELDGELLLPAVLEWWDFFCQARPKFQVALSALDRMLPDLTASA